MVCEPGGMVPVPSETVASKPWPACTLAGIFAVPMPAFVPST
jgi:hypothetical protein